MPRLDETLHRLSSGQPEKVFLNGASVWTYAAAEREVNSSATRIRALAAGAPAVLRGPNSTQWVIDLLALFRAGSPVVLIPAEMPEPEAAALIRLSGARLEVEDGEARRCGTECGRESGMEYGTPAAWPKEAGVGFVTSGSTGEPRIALRSHDSLTAEGQRYRDLWGGSPELHLGSERTDVLLALAPLCHAYTFGAALCAALAAGATLAIGIFRSPHSAADLIVESGATTLPLIPAMARMLATAGQGLPVHSRLRIAMAGAGPVDQALSSAFERRFGIALSRNYGSSETGAVLASLAPVAGEVTGPAITGAAMPGVDCELVPGASGEGSQLWVRLAHPPLGYLAPQGFQPARLGPGGWWPMGDLFEFTANRSLRMLARVGDQVRRGGHTIQPREIEGVLLDHPAVSEAYVRGGRDPQGEETVEAHVALVRPGSASVEELRDHLAGRLAAYKIPSAWRLYDALPKTWSRKVSSRHLTAPESGPVPSLADMARMYRLPSALLAAERIGLFDALKSGPRLAGHLAATLSCDPLALQVFLEFLTAAGILRAHAGQYELPGSVDQAWPAVAALEDRLYSHWLSPEVVAAAIRQGVHGRSFERGNPDPEFLRSYADAFCGPWQKMASILLRRRLGLRAGGSAIEVGRAAGRITLDLRSAAGVDCRFYALDPQPAPLWPGMPAAVSATAASWESLPLAPRSLDAIVLTNCIHWLPPDRAGAVLRRMAAALTPGGALAIVDIFVDEGQSSWLFQLDWLTHGGVYHARLPGLTSRLEEAGFGGMTTSPIGSGPARLVVCAPCCGSEPSTDFAFSEAHL